MGLLLAGAVVLQLVAGVALAVGGLVMTVSQRRMGPPEGRWPLSRKLTAAGAGLIGLVLLEVAAIFAAALLGVR